jgi:hypothetical protein
LLLLLLDLSCLSPFQMGTQKESFVELTERIGRKTGGISVYPFTSAKRGQEQPVAYLMVRLAVNMDECSSLYTCTQHALLPCIVHVVRNARCLACSFCMWTYEGLVQYAWHVHNPRLPLTVTCLMPPCSSILLLLCC